MADRRRRLGAVLVTVGTFGSAVMQWYLVWLAARLSGVAAVGAYALVFSVATPVFTATSLGLRNLYLTHDVQAGLAAYLRVRSLGSLVGAALAFALATAAGGPPGLAVAVCLMKVADAVLDLAVAWFQSRKRFVELGLLLLANPLLSALAATVVVLVTRDVTAGVVASGLVSALVAAVALARVEWRGERARSWLPWPVLRSAVAVTVAQLVMAVVASVPLWFAAVRGGPEAAGPYGAASYLLVAANLAGATYQTLTLPQLRDARRAGPEALRQAMARWTLLALGAGIPVAVLLGFALPALLAWVYGGDAFALTTGSSFALSGAALLTVVAYVVTAALLVENRYAHQSAAALLALAGALVGGVAGIAAGLDGTTAAVASALSGSAVRLAAALTFRRASRSAAATTPYSGAAERTEG